MNHNQTITNSTVSIKEKIRDYIIRETFAEKDKLRDDSLVFNEGYFDSMGFIRLIAFLENEFGLKINDEDLLEENFESINAITTFISNKKE
jgi:acyl carrier protein